MGEWKIGKLSGSTLKMIAIVTMFIDHVGAAVLARVLLYGGRVLREGAHPAIEWMINSGQLLNAYILMRQIGRVAFPIFCFLLVEGFEHTHDRKKYVLRLGLFALISEIPFDLAFSSKVLETGYQNVFFTLFIGVLVMWACRAVEEKKEWNRMLTPILYAVIVVAGMALAWLLKTDYDARGVICIMVLYFTRGNRIFQLVAGALSFMWETPAPVAFLPLAFYNGKRGWNMKYFFYLFYPLHLLILFGVCALMGISQYPAI